MRIALFTGNYNYLREGANQALNRLVGFLETQAGHELRVYSPVTRTPAFEPTGTLVPIASVRLPVRGEFRLALGLPRAARHDLKRFAPDLVHVATPDILCTRAQTFALNEGLPIVASLHTRFETYLDHYGLGWSRTLVEAHLRRFYRRSSHVLVPTPSLIDDVKALRSDDSVSLWSRGVDRGLFHPSRRDAAWRHARGIADREIVVLFFGRLVREKGVALFCSIVATLQQQGLNVRPLIVGDGPERESFRPLPGLIATGHLEGAELARSVASADIMLTPSETEAFGNVMLEGMASGLPVVSADAPSARALIENGVSGYLCPTSNNEQFVTTMKRLTTSSELRREIGHAASRAASAYSWDEASASVERVYRRLIAGPPASALLPAVADKFQCLD